MARLPCALQMTAQPSDDFGSSNRNEADEKDEGRGSSSERRNDRKTLTQKWVQAKDMMNAPIQPIQPLASPKHTRHSAMAAQLLHWDDASGRIGRTRMSRQSSTAENLISEPPSPSRGRFSLPTPPAAQLNKRVIVDVTKAVQELQQADQRRKSMEKRFFNFRSNADCTITKTVSSFMEAPLAGNDFDKTPSMTSNPGHQPQRQAMSAAQALVEDGADGDRRLAAVMNARYIQRKIQEVSDEQSRFVEKWIRKRDAAAKETGGDHFDARRDVRRAHGKLRLQRKACISRRLASDPNKDGGRLAAAVPATNPRVSRLAAVRPSVGNAKGCDASNMAAVLVATNVVGSKPPVGRRGSVGLSGLGVPSGRVDLDASQNVRRKSSTIQEIGSDGMSRTSGSSRSWSDSDDSDGDGTSYSEDSTCSSSTGCEDDDAESPLSRLGMDGDLAALQDLNVAGGKSTRRASRERRRSSAAGRRLSAAAPGSDRRRDSARHRGRRGMRRRVTELPRLRTRFRDQSKILNTDSATVRSFRGHSHTRCWSEEIKTVRRKNELFAAKLGLEKKDWLTVREWSSRSTVSAYDFNSLDLKFAALRKEELRKEDLVRKVQQKWRAYRILRITRAKLAHRRNSLIRIQRAWRHKIAWCVPLVRRVQQRHRKEVAATKIQAVWRGVFTRRGLVDVCALHSVKWRMAKLHEELSSPIKPQVIRIQALWRGFLARRMFAKHREWLREQAQDDETTRSSFTSSHCESSSGFSTRKQSSQKTRSSRFDSSGAISEEATKGCMNSPKAAEALGRSLPSTVSSFHVEEANSFMSTCDRMTMESPLSQRLRREPLEANLARMCGLKPTYCKKVPLSPQFAAGPPLKVAKGSPRKRPVWVRPTGLAHTLPSPSELGSV